MSSESRLITLTQQGRSRAQERSAQPHEWRRESKARPPKVSEMPRLRPGLAGGVLPVIVEHCTVRFQAVRERCNNELLTSSSPPNPARAMMVWRAAGACHPSMGNAGCSPSSGRSMDGKAARDGMACVMRAHPPCACAAAIAAPLSAGRQRGRGRPGALRTRVWAAGDPSTAAGSGRPHQAEGTARGAGQAAGLGCRV